MANGGEDVGRAARVLYPDGVVVDSAPGSDAANVDHTRSLMLDAGVPAIFYAAFSGDVVHARVDILARENATWRVIEVKSATAPKPHHREDAAFQAFVIASAGVSVGDVDVVHVNKSYIRGTDGIDWGQFFVRSPIFIDADSEFPEIQKRVATMRAVLQCQTPPEIDPGPHCDQPRPCEFKTRCLASKPADWVGFLPRLTARQAEELRTQGIESITAVPADFALSIQQARIRDALAAGQGFVAADLASRLNGFGPPACYLDFEAMAPAIPLYPGTSPYQQLPFQWSMHVMHADGRLEHKEFLADGATDPSRPFAEALLAAAEKNEYPVLVYSAYEERCLKDIAQRFPDLAPKVNDLIGRLRDLLPVVRNGVYLREFRFSNSIKYVAPALSKGFSYEAIGSIKDGIAAANAFMAIASGAVTDSATIAANRRDLLAYCKHDTQAMVEVHGALSRLISRGGT